MLLTSEWFIITVQFIKRRCTCMGNGIHNLVFERIISLFIVLFFLHILKFHSWNCTTNHIIMIKKTTLAIPISYMSTKFSCYFFLIQTIHRWWDLEKIIQLIWSKKKKKGKSMFHASLFGIWRHSRNQKHLSLLFDLIYKLF